MDVYINGKLQKKSMIFKQHPDYPMLWVSNCGSVVGKSLWATDILACRGLSQQKSNLGYMYVNATVSFKKRKHLFVHRLVARCFVAGYQEGLDVDHIDHNKSNNHFTNLQWLTRGQNQRKNRDNGLGNVKIDAKTADEIKRLYSKGSITQKEIGDKYGLHQSSISLILYGGSWHNGSKVINKTGRTRLTIEDARAIRTSGLPVSQLAKQYGKHPHTIRRILWNRILPD